MKYKIGTKIRHRDHLFNDRYIGFQEGYITEIKPFSRSSFHCRFIISKSTRIILGEMVEIKEQVGRESDFYTSSNRPPEVIPEYW